MTTFTNQEIINNCNKLIEKMNDRINSLKIEKERMKYDQVHCYLLDRKIKEIEEIIIPDYELMKLEYTLKGLK